MKHLPGFIIRPFSVLLGTAVLLTTPLPAVAQQGALEEIVVTARYREEALQDTPLAISAITAAEMEVRAFTSSYEIGYTVPNASLRPAQAAFGNTMTAFIRGIGQNDFDFAFEPGVGIYIDDIYHPFTLASETDLMDLERVEVLRGPQGTLFGRGSIGGAIRYVSKKPEGSNTGYFQATTGSYDRVDLRGSYDLALTDNVYARVTGMSKDRDGFVDVIDFACARPSRAGTFTPQTTNRAKDCKVGTQGGENIHGVRGILRWEASTDLDLQVSADYQREDSEAVADVLNVAVAGSGFDFGGVNGVPYDSRFITPNIYSTYSTFDDPQNNLKVKPQNGLEKWTISGRGEWQINDKIAATAILAYTDLTTTLSQDADGSPLNLQMVDGVQTVDYMQAELRFSGRLWDRLDYTFGGFFYDGESINDQMVSIPFLGAILPPFSPPTSGVPFVDAHNVHQNRNESGFAHAVFDITDRLAFTAGVRFSHDKKVVNFDNTRVQNPEVIVEDEHFDWKVGIDFKWTDDIMTYASVSTGYRPGSYNPRPFQATQVVAVDQEESRAYELGMKSDWFDRSFRFNVAGFYTDWKTRILPVGGTECLLLDLGPPPVYATVAPGTPGAVTDSLGNTCLTTVSRTFYENGPADIYGFEIEAQWQPTDELTINGAYGYTHWDSPDINDDPTIVSDRPVYVPEENWTVSASYRFPLGNGSSLTPRLDVYGQTEICTANVLTTTAFPEASCSAGYELLNARMEWASANQSWKVALGVTNLTDEEYFLNKFDLTAFGQPHATGRPGRDREWYVTVRRNFN